MSLAMDRSVHAALDALCESSGRTKKAVVSRVLRWFLAQDKTTRTIVLDDVEAADQEAICRLMLERLSRASPLEPSRRERVAG